MKINNTNIGDNFPTYIVAELSANHNQNIDTAIQLIHAAKDCGANAVKLQTYTPDTITIDCHNDYFKIKDNELWKDKYLYDLYKEAYTPWEWFPKLKEEATKLGLDIFSSPFDPTAVDFLESMDVPAYKVASFEVTDHILLRKIAQTQKPVILSTGITELDEISEAIKILRANGTTDLCVLKCTSAYPAKIEDANLKTIQNIKETFNCVAGLSDHTLGIEVPIAAVCLGAKFIEKHFTLDRNGGSPDDAFSLEPSEFKQMVDSIRKVEAAVGRVKYEKSNNEKKSNIFRRSLFVVEDTKKGERFTKENVRSIRPGNGLHTRYYDNVLKSVCTQDIKRGTPLEWNLIGKAFNILFLGYEDNMIIDYLKQNGENIIQTSEKITVEYAKNFDFVISYGYSHIIKKDIIALFPNRIINLHISYLPWNKGSDPNLWSIIDNTKKGVTIHYMDVGLDTGDIIVQKEVEFDYEVDSFSITYQRLREEIEILLIENWKSIKNETCNKIKQDLNEGTKHKVADRPKNFDKLLTEGWNTNINKFLNNYFKN